jgi:transcriptional regulator with XRE-family HTH domain
MARLVVKKGTKAKSRDIISLFGCHIRELRLTRQMSQGEMAEKFGMDRSFISDLERGRKSPRLPMIKVIAEGFGISVGELMKDL